MSAGGNETRPSCNETQPTCNESTCWLCGTPLEVRRTGRPRRFCSPSHRVGYHRLRNRSDSPASGAGAVPVIGPHRLVPTRKGSGEAAEVLRDLADDLEGFRPTARVAELRRLATYGQDVQGLLDTIDTSAWVLHEFTAVGYDLERLQDLRQTVERLLELDDLADDVERLARQLRYAREQRDELLWAAEELEESEVQTP